MRYELTLLENAEIEVIDGDRGKNYPHQSELQDNGFCLFLSAKNVTKTGFVFDETQYISKEKDELLNNGKLGRGDIVITTRGTIGNVALYSAKVSYDNIRINSGMLIIRCGKNISNQYLYQALRSDWFQRQIMAVQSGSAQPQLPKSHFLKMSIPLPILSIQQKIANILQALDDKIELNSAINNNLEQQAKTLFKSWFVDFEPFDESFVDSPIGTKIPHSLQMVKIGSLSHILETGKRPKGGAVATGVPSIGAENVKRLGEVNFASTKYIPVEFAQKMDKGKVHGYELMLYKDGGKPGTFIPHFSMFGEGFPYDDFYINEHVFKLDFGDKGFNEFCYFYLQTDYPYNWLANNGGKAAVPGINQQDVNSIWIYHPDNPIVKEYCKWVQPIFTTILRNCSQNVKLSQLRDALLPKLMSGELDVSGIDL